MIEYIQGKITGLNPTQIILETGGIGYGIQITLPAYAVLNGQTEAKLYIFESIREDAHILYGFLHPDERQLFLLLISVSGIGANTARMIMSSYSAREIQEMIASGNERALNSIKGIGTKTAQRIIVDLKDKIVKINIEGSTADIQTRSISSEIREEAVSALNMLGFATLASQKAVDSILKEQPALKVEQVIRLALKMM
jgi:Holliday junction DNA helicase RuvA